MFTTLFSGRISTTPPPSVRGVVPRRYATRREEHLAAARYLLAFGCQGRFIKKTPNACTDAANLLLHPRGMPTCRELRTPWSALSALRLGRSGSASDDLPPEVGGAATVLCCP